MENGVQHSRMHYVHPLTDVNCFHCKCIGKGKVVVLPKRLILIFLINGIIEAILVAFSMKMSRACTGMLSYENNAFKFSKKLRKPQTVRASRAPYFQDPWNFYFSTNQSALHQKHERKSSRRAVLYIFQNIEIWILITFH